MVERLEEEKPAGIVVGDNPGLASYGANEASFQTPDWSRPPRVLPEYRARLGRSPLQPAYAPQVSVSRAVLDADVVISLPKFKTHGLTIMTGPLRTVTAFCPARSRPCCTRRPERLISSMN